jgi:prepilin-type processing-associated H-X9-DG protein
MSDPELKYPTRNPKSIPGRILDYSWIILKYPFAILAGIGVAGLYLFMRIMIDVQVDFLPRETPLYEAAAVVLLWLGFMVTPIGRRFLEKQKLVICVLTCGGALVISFFALGQYMVREKNKPNVIDNMKSAHMIFMHNASEDPEGKFPPSTPYANTHVFDTSATHETYLHDSLIALFLIRDYPDLEERRAIIRDIMDDDPIDWEHVARLGSQNFVYLAWETKSAEDIKIVLEAQKLLSPETLNEDLHVEGREPFPRLKYDEERTRLYHRHKSGETNDDDDLSLIEGFNPRETPILFGRPRKIPKGSSTYMIVLFLDGHVERAHSPDSRFDLDAIAELMEN